MTTKALTALRQIWLRMAQMEPVIRLQMQGWRLWRRHITQAFE